MSYVEESQKASSTVILEPTAENITAVHLDIKDLAASFTVYKIGEFTYIILYCHDIVILGICGLLTIINGIVDIRL